MAQNHQSLKLKSTNPKYMGTQSSKFSYLIMKNALVSDDFLKDVFSHMGIHSTEGII